MYNIILLCMSVKSLSDPLRSILVAAECGTKSRADGRADSVSEFGTASSFPKLIASRKLNIMIIMPSAVSAAVNAYYQICIYVYVYRHTQGQCRRRRVHVTGRVSLCPRRWWRRWTYNPGRVDGPWCGGELGWMAGRVYVYRNKQPSATPKDNQNTYCMQTATETNIL